MCDKRRTVQHAQALTELCNLIAKYALARQNKTCYRKFCSDNFPILAETAEDA